MADNEIFYEGGVDLDSSLSFADGDILLSKYEENLGQAVKNRLNTELDELDIFYEDYGSILKGFLGWKADETSLNFIQAEIEHVLNYEPRLSGFESDISYSGSGRLKIDLILYPINSEENIELNLVLNENGELEIIENEEEGEI